MLILGGRVSGDESRRGAERYPGPLIDKATGPLFQRTSGDLLRDALHLDGRAVTENDPAICSVYARSAIIMGFAAIEAATDDALATVLNLMTSGIPAGRRREAPWRHFAGRNARRVDLLRRRRTFPRKRKYVLDQIARTTGRALETSLADGIEQLRDFRNRIIHMRYAYRPERYEPTLDALEARRSAAEASGCARRYLAFVSGAFTEIKLPIPTRP